MATKLEVPKKELIRYYHKMRKIDIDRLTYLSNGDLFGRSKPIATVIINDLASVKLKIDKVIIKSDIS